MPPSAAAFASATAAELSHFGHADKMRFKATIPSSHESRGLQCLAAFFVLYHAASWHPTPIKVAEDTHRQLQQQTAPSLTSKSAIYTDTASQAKTGDPNLTRGQKAVRVAFYLWLSLLNLLATSTLWARAADVFDSSAASRLFGFLGAGATIGIVLHILCIKRGGKGLS